VQSVTPTSRYSCGNSFVTTAFTPARTATATAEITADCSTLRISSERINGAIVTINEAVNVFSALISSVFVFVFRCKGVVLFQSLSYFCELFIRHSVYFVFTKEKGDH